MRRATASILTFLLASVLTPMLRAQSARNVAADGDLVELEHSTLTMDKVTRFMETSSALAKLAKTHPAVAAAMESDSQANETIGDTARRIEGLPEVVATLKQHGLAPREFVVLSMTVLQASLAAGTVESGADRAKMAADAHVNPANITFMEQHKAEMEELQKKYPLQQDE